MELKNLSVKTWPWANPGKLLFLKGRSETPRIDEKHAFVVFAVLVPKPVCLEARQAPAGRNLVRRPCWQTQLAGRGSMCAVLLPQSKAALLL